MCKLTAFAIERTIVVVALVVCVLDCLLGWVTLILHILGVVMRQVTHFTRVASAANGPTILTNPERSLTLGGVTVACNLSLLADAHVDFVHTLRSVHRSWRLLAVNIERGQVHGVDVLDRLLNDIALVRRHGHAVTSLAHVLSKVRVEADAHRVNRLHKWPA